MADEVERSGYDVKYLTTKDREDNSGISVGVISEIVSSYP